MGALEGAHYGVVDKAAKTSEGIHGIPSLAAPLSNVAYAALGGRAEYRKQLLLARPSAKALATTQPGCVQAGIPTNSGLQR